VPELALQLGHSLWITAISASPVGGLVASADEASVRLWDVAAGEVLHTFPASGTVAFSPDGSFLATSTLDRVRVWDVPRGTLRKSFGAPGIGHPLAFTAPHLLVAGCSDGKVRKWDLRKGKEVAAIAAHSKPVTLIAAQGNLLATSDGDAVIKLWDTRKRRLLRTLEPRGTETRALAFSADGRTVASAHTSIRQGLVEREEVALWSTETGQLVSSLPVATRVAALCFSPDSQRLLVAGPLSTEWSVSGGNRLRALPELSGATAMHLDQSGTLIAGLGLDVSVVELESGRLKRTFPGVNNSSETVAVSPDGSYIASGHRFGQVRIWSLQDPGPIRTLSEHFGFVRKVAFSPDGKWLVCVASGHEVPGSARVWRTVDWSLERELRTPEMWGVDTEFSPDSGTLMVLSRREPSRTGDTPPRLLFWEVTTGASKPFISLEGHHRQAAYTRDGSTIATCSAGAGIDLHDPATGKIEARTGGQRSAVKAFAVAPGGKWMATCDIDDLVRTWAIKTPGKVVKLTGPRGRILSLGYSTHGRLAATVADGSVGFWDVGASVPRLIPDAHFGFVEGCAWLPDDRRLVTAGEDGAVRIWETRSRRLIATLQVLPPVAEDELPKDWIIYTPEGYYIGSPGAERWIRWRVDGRLLPAARYAGRFRSADRIRQALRP